MVESRAWAYWNRYETTGDLGDLGVAIAAMAEEEGPEVLASVLDYLDRRAAGEDITLEVDEADRSAWAGLFSDVAGAVGQDPEGLDRAIAAMTTSLELVESTVATILLGRYLALRGSPEDLRAGVELMRSGLDRLEADDPFRESVHVLLCNAVATLYTVDDSPPVSVELAETFTAALAELPADGPDWTSTAELGWELAGDHLFDSRDPAEDLALSALALAASPPGSVRRPVALYLRAGQLAIRSLADTSLPSVVEAVALLREALALPDGPFPRALVRTHLSLILCQLYDLTGDAALVDEAVELAREGLADAPSDHRTLCLENLVTALTSRYEDRHDPADLNELIDLLDVDDSTLTARGIGLACAALYNRFLASGTHADLEQSVARGRRALELFPDEDAGLADTLGNIANALRLRSELSGDAADLDEAVTLYRRAVEMTPRTGADRVRVCANLSGALRERAQRTSSDTDRREARWAAQEAMAVAIPGSPGFPRARSALAWLLADEFKRTGDRATLDESMRLMREVLAQNPVPVEMNSLGTVLQSRFEMTGSTIDLNEAIDLYRAVLDATEPGSPLHTTASGNLGSVLASRFRLTATRDDVDEAVAVLRRAEAHADATVRSMVQINLAQSLATRYQAFGDPADLDAAVEASRQAHEMLPPRSRRRPGYLAGWGTQLLVRAMRQENADDLAQAVAVLTEALAAMPPTEPNRSRYLVSLAESLLAQGTADGRRAAADTLRSAATLETGPAQARVRAARRWAQIAHDDEDTASALEALRLAVGLLPLLAWRGVPRTDQERELAELTGLACDAAALAISADRPQLAVELLEHGRGVLWAQLLETRTDLTVLQETDPALADRLTEVRAALDRVSDPSADASPTAADRAALAGEWDGLVHRVRELPGFADFLQPPTFATLARAASHGPVVLLNVSTLRCDALIVRAGTVTVHPLPDLTAEAVTETAATYLELFARPSAGLAAAVTLHRKADELLRWLGRHLTGPVLAALGDTARVWWCPTGPLGVLPIHAGIDPAGACALDQVVSSYTPTLRALAGARSGPVDSAGDRRVLVVAMERTPGAPDLVVQPEVDLLTGLFGDRSTLLEGPSVAEVCRELPAHAWVHLACHGLQHPDRPSRSGVALRDGTLSVLDIAALSLPHSELAFLSACQTAAVGSTLTDEAIHLAAALNTIGFRHVVATLWPVHDAIAPVMAGLVYPNLTDGDVATQLNAAARRLRAAPDTAPPIFWAPYIHIGP